jgi:hypothetical protein
MATHITRLSQNPRLFFALCAILICVSSHGQTPPKTPPPDAPATDNGIDETPVDAQTNPEPAATIPTTDPAAPPKVEPKPLAPALSFFQTPERQQALLEKYIASPLGHGQSLWLDVNGQKLLAIWHPETSGNPKGAALLLPNQDGTPNDPYPIANLQKYLNSNGWATLALALPAPNSILPPPVSPITVLAVPKEPSSTTTESTTTESTTTENTDTNPSKKEEPPSDNEKDVVHKDDEEKANEAAQEPPSDTTANKDEPIEPDAAIDKPTTAIPPAVEPVALASITAGLQHMQSLGQFNNVIIAEGLSATRTLYFLESLAQNKVSLSEPPQGATQNHPLRAVILINAEHQLAEIPTFDVLKVINTSPISIFDVYDTSYRQSASHTLLTRAKQRKEAAQTGSPPIFISRQILPAASGLKGETRLTRVIRGFLRQHAEGVEAAR